MFDHPEIFDVRRKDNVHLTFSAGTHFCAGAALGRLELEVVLGTLMRELPGLRLAVPADQIRRDEKHLLESFLEIPVTW